MTAEGLFNEFISSNQKDRLITISLVIKEDMLLGYLLLLICFMLLFSFGSSFQWKIPIGE